jgi:hypothetical protein
MRWEPFVQKEYMRLEKWRAGTRARAVLINDQLQTLIKAQLQILILYD